MRAELTAAIDRRLAGLLSTRARRKSVILRVLPARWLEPVLTPAARRLRIKLIVAGLALWMLFAAIVYLVNRA